MLKIALSGCNGRMGQVIVDIVENSKDAQIVAGFDLNAVKRNDFPIYTDPFEFIGYCDVIIDFSNPSSTEQLLTYCIDNKVPIIICTTGHTLDQLQNIREASQYIPIFRSGNMSLGINLVMELIQKSASVLGDQFDVEIIEKHHNQKVDAPSGTAIMLADAVSAALPYETKYIYDRHQTREKRDPNEIGIHSLRGGTIVGEHSVVFCGRDEIIEIKHSALSREVFAVGAVQAARFMALCKTPGVYDMFDVIHANE